MTIREEELIKIICRAISERKLIQFKYKGLDKIAEPYLIGVYEKNNKIVLRGYSVGGVSKSGKAFDWKIYELNLMKDIKVRHDLVEKIRVGYNPIDSEMSRIICRM